MARPITKVTKLGTQTGFRLAIWQAGYSHTEFAEMSGIRPMSHVRLAMYGYCPPSQELRRVAVKMLGLPLEELFTEESLALTHRPQRKSGRRPADSGDAVRTQ